MNPVHKRLRFHTCPSSPAAVDDITPPCSGPQLLSHDALLLPPLAASAGGGAPREEDEEEEEEGYLLVEEDTTDSSLIITMEDSQVEVKAARRRAMRKRKRKLTEEEDDGGGGASESEEEEAGVEVEIDRQLDQSLETKSKQHNLTTVNVRNIIHEVITNEHVVAMMKAAINETEAVPPFEPKMTRSKFKEVVEKGVVIPAWNISPIKKPSEVNKAPQFVDIPLAEEDSSDEEYRPDEEDEDETAEDTFQESDMESTASSPRGTRLNRVEEDGCSPWQTSRTRSRRSRAGFASMGPPPVPKAPPPKAVTDSTFLEKLHAVEEELAVCMEPYQPLSESEDEVGLMAYRTRSKRPLRDVPLGRLEAELRAPDITPDMYDSSSAHEDREWTDWLRGLMTSEMDNEEECDDEDDPEYNFLADIDEPDQEDYRDDKAVRITKKEVNELMEELFETLKEDLVGQEVEDEGHEEEEEPQEETHPVQIHTPEEQHNTGSASDEVEDEPITALHTVKQQLVLIKRRQQTHTLRNTHTHCAEPYTLKLDRRQRSRLQQQLQQHVQLLTQIHLLSSPVAKLQSEAETTRQFLFELDVLAQRGELLMSSGRSGFCSVFRASNLQGALQLLEELQKTPISYRPQHPTPDARGHTRCFPVMPADLAWLFATRPVFLYPELLPCVSLDPALYCPRRTAAFTAAEDCLLVLGLRNMEGSCDPTKLVSQFLLRKTLVQVRRRILQCCRPGFPDNIVKAFRYQRVLWPMLVACRHVDPAEQRPPVEREERVMPLWLVRSLPVIYPTIKRYNSLSGDATEAPPPCNSGRARQSHLTFLRSASDTYSFPPSTRYPPRLPKHLDFRRIGFVLLNHSSPLPDGQVDSSPLPDGQPNSSPPSPPCSPRALSPPQVLRRLLLFRTDPPTDIITNSAVSTTTRELLRQHFQTLVSLRKRRKSDEEDVIPPPDCPAASQGDAQVADDVIRITEEEEEDEEEESEVLLTLSDSSPSSPGTTNPKEAGLESEQEVTLTPSRAEDDEDEEKSVIQLQNQDQDQNWDQEQDQRESEDVVFAQDYLVRVCDAVQVCPGLSEQLLLVLDQFSAGGPLEASGAPEVLYDRLSRLLRPWPQLLRDFAAFLSPEQARRCGLLLEQQLFERSRRFLQRLGRSLGEGSSPYQQVVSVLQGSPAPLPEDMDKISFLLKRHPDLQQEFWEFFQQLRAQSSPLGTSSEATEMDCMSQNPRDRKRVDGETFWSVCPETSVHRPPVRRVGSVCPPGVSGYRLDLHSLRPPPSIMAAVLLALLCFPAAGAWRKDVLELGHADFDYLATEHETMLVKFYAPWCGHCKKLAPDFEKAASRLKGTVQLAKVDCTANSETCGRFGVSGYPTLKIFRNGKDSGPYDGPRTADGIYHYMKKQTGPDSVHLKTEEDLQTFINHYDASIIGVFSGEDSPHLSEFLRAAGLLREQFRFAHTLDVELGEKYGVNSECVLLFRPPRLANKFEDDVVVFRDYLTIGSLRRFIRDHIYGLCPHMTVENKDRLRVRDLLTAYYDLDYHHNPRGSNYWRNRVMKVASKYAGRALTFSVANKKDFLSELEDDFGLGTSDGGELPFVTIRTKLGHKYTMREEFTRDGQSLERFLDDYFAGRLKRFVKSEPLPEKNAAAVQVVVAESFDDVVNDPKKDVLIQFYSPSCPHCKKLEPVYRELADTLYHDPNIVIAKMNAADNDVPLGYDVLGYPTIYFAPVGKKNEPIKYEGGRELKDFLKFLKREASHSLVLSGSKDEL